MPVHERLEKRLHSGATMREAAAQWVGAPINGQATVVDRRGGRVAVKTRDVAQHLGADCKFARSRDLPLVRPAVALATAFTELSAADKLAQRQRGAKRSDAFYSADLDVLDPAQPALGVQQLDYLTYVARTGRDRYQWVSVYPVDAATRATREASGLPIWPASGSAGRGNPAAPLDLAATTSRPDRAAARHPDAHTTTLSAPTASDRPKCGKLAALLLGVALLARIAEGLPA